MLKKLRDTGEIVLGVRDASIPFSYADETGQKLARLGMDLLGIWGPLREGSPWAKLGGQISHLYQTTLGHTIAGGTAEILRTTVAVRGLGLPAEPKSAVEAKAR